MHPSQNHCGLDGDRGSWEGKVPAGGCFCSGLLPAVPQEPSRPGRGASPRRSLWAAQVLSSLQPSLLRAHLVKSVTGPSLPSACSGQQPRDQQRPCCSFPSPGDGGIVGFDVQGQGWGQAVCAHESLARLQLPLKCSSDQDEREGSPSPNHLALIAGRNASLRPPRPAPWGGGTACSSLIPRLSAGLARRVRAWEQKGVSAGQPEIGSRWRRCWEFGHLCSQP